MSAKAVLPVYQTITDQDMTTSVTSLVTDVGSVDNIGIQATFTGTPDGEFFIEGSVNNTTWVPLDFDTPILASGTGDDFIFSIRQFPYPKIRLRYVATSGSGTLNAWVFAKRLGG